VFWHLFWVVVWPFGKLDVCCCVVGSRMGSSTLLLLLLLLALVLESNLEGWVLLFTITVFVYDCLGRGLFDVETAQRLWSEVRSPRFSEASIDC